MGRCARFVVWAAALASSSTLWAADLTKVDRSIARLPQFKTASPEYCLLVFGPEADTRVWLVWDGDVLYVDRNGNGDLTEPGERVEADLNTSHPDEDQFRFKAGNLQLGPHEHKNLRVSRTKLDVLRDKYPLARKLLERNPAARGWQLTLDVDVPGYKGIGIGGRLFESAGSTDVGGVLQFASKREDPPILHFGGPWQITFGDLKEWKVGAPQRVDLVLSTPGLGPGSTVAVQYEDVVPPELKPSLKVTYPPAADQSPVEQSYELAQRCCTISLYGSIVVPTNVGTGNAKVEISLPSWPGASVASTVHEVPVLPGDSRPKPALEPISPRLVGRLPHRDPQADIVAIEFSPDGRRLIAGSYPGGAVHVWDLATGQGLLTIETGKYYRGSWNYFAVSPDWKTLYAPCEKQQKFEQFEKDGKVLRRFEYDDEICVWDLASGAPQPSLRLMPARRNRSFALSRDGRRLVAWDQLPGEYEDHPLCATTIWDLSTGVPFSLPNDTGDGGVMSAEGRLLAGGRAISKEDLHTKAMRVVNIATGEEQWSTPMWNDRSLVLSSMFLPDGKLVTGTVNVYESKTDFGNAHSWQVFWDATTGLELYSTKTVDRNEQFAFSKASPDGQQLALCGYQSQAGNGRVYLVDVAQRATKVVDLGPDTLGQAPVFDPRGKRLAVCVLDSRTDSSGVDLPVEQRPQPRIVLIDTASGDIVETLYAPQAYQLSSAFSPDGRLLATSGHGEVLLWDMTRP